MRILTKLLTVILILGICGLLTSARAATLPCSSIKSYSFTQDELTFFHISHQPLQRYYLMTNTSKNPVFLEQSPHIPAAQAGWASQVDPGHSSVLAMKKTRFGMRCMANNTAENCADVLQVCQLAAPIIIEHTKLEKGSYWVIENMEPAVNAEVVSPYNEKKYDAEITHLYQTIPQSHSANLYTRLYADSHYFLGRRYSLFANGEGRTGTYDQNPLYRTDKFDCLTYVSTVIALVNASTLPQFIQNMKTIGYKKGNVDFVTRNHFTSVDYNLNNQRNGFLTDITATIVNKKGRPVYVEKQTVIDKGLWLKQLSSDRVRLLSPISNQKEQTLMTQLANAGAALPPVKTAFTYIPMSALFSRNGEANLALFKQIPPGTVLEIVRPISNGSGHARQNALPIGSGVDVTHLGFVVETPKGLMFREASSIMNKVTDVPLVHYLRGYLHEPSVVGIHLERVNAVMPA